MPNRISMQIVKEGKPTTLTTTRKLKKNWQKNRENFPEGCSVQIVGKSKKSKYKNCSSK